MRFIAMASRQRPFQSEWVIPSFKGLPWYAEHPRNRHYCKFLFRSGWVKGWRMRREVEEESWNNPLVDGINFVHGYLGVRQ